MSPSADGTRLDLRDLYDIVIKRRRLLMPALGISFAIALGYILLSPTRYTASLSILVDPRERVPVGLELQPMPSTPDPALVESRMRELTSRAVLRRVIASEDLLNDPDAKPSIVGAMVGYVEDVVRGKLTPEQRLDRAVESLAKEISAKRSERSYVVDVDVKAKTPEKSVHLGEALVKAFFAQQAAFSEELVQKQTAWLDGRINDLRTRVEVAERRVQSYRDSAGIAETEGHTSPEQQLADANGALVSAQGRRAEVEARYAQLKAAVAQSGAPESINDAIHSATIEKLRQDYAAFAREEADLKTALGPRHPSYVAAQARLISIREQITAEVGRIVVATDRELQAAKAAEASAAKLVTRLETSTNAMGDRQVELAELEREATTLRATYEKIITARENVRRDIVDSPLSVVVDPPAASTSRTSPKIVPALLIALAAGINIWIIWALLEKFRERPPSLAAADVESAATVEPETAANPNWRFIRVPSLDNPRTSSIRGRASSAPSTRATLIGDAMGSGGPFSSAIYDILALLEGHFGEDEPTARLAVAAVSPRAGASTIALALARAAADSGYRVLLADCHGLNSPFANGEERARIEGHDGGEIIVMPYPRGRKSFGKGWEDEAGFDLILLDCGALATACHLILRAKAADALLVAAPSDLERKTIIAEIVSAKLETYCLGVTLTPVVGEAQRQAS